MLAAVIERQGDIANLAVRDWPDPVPGPGEVLVEVRAVGLNHLDIFVRRGMPGFPVTTPFISGGDIAGRVAALGESVTRWRVGDRVAVNPMTPAGMMGEEVQGGMAQLCTVPETHLVRIPDGMDEVTAAAIPINFGTALRMLETIGHLQPGELVLVIGASGGVGTAALQLIRQRGARSIAVTRGADKASLLAPHADHVVDMAAEDFSRAAWRLSGKQGVDMVLNYTGGDTWVPSLRAMRQRGRLVTCGATAGYDPPEDIRYIWVRELQVLGSNGYTKQDIERAFEICAAGEAKPLISRVLDIHQVQEAHRLLESREVVGKVVLTIPPRS
ncbi:alcohol dehydrogenase catalytic domain-containing protein [Falsiroseomonas sp.]|uniref:alcohol dehydrogenase catalytic domain-containing protein n=1 Tax=Falsiroseomonas sp. TaxID=2870721 RepID=UPI0035636431